MVNVAVLLSAYNGDKFIKEQIESILNQNGVNVKLTIRNDGGDPEEKTRRIIREYVAKDERVSLLEGENLGCAKSFWQLLRESYIYYIKNRYSRKFPRKCWLQLRFCS